MPRSIPGIAAAACAVLAVGCGRIDFAALPATGTDAAATDASAGDGPAQAIASADNTAQGCNEDTGSAVVLSLAPTHANDLLVIGVSYCCDGPSSPIITDGEALVWQSAGSAVTDSSSEGADYVAVFYAIDPGGGLTAITVSPGASHFVAAIASEWENVDISAPLDGYASQVLTGDLGDSGPLTPAHAGDVFAVVGDDDHATVPATAGSGFTLTAPGYYPTATQQGIAMAYEIDAGSATVHGTLQWNTTFTLPTVMAAFHPAP